MSNVTRWLDNFFNIQPFSKMKIYPIALKCQSGFNISSNTKKTSKIFQTLLNFCHSVKYGQIWSHWPRGHFYFVASLLNNSHFYSVLFDVVLFWLILYIVRSQIALFFAQNNSAHFKQCHVLMAI